MSISSAPARRHGRSVTAVLGPTNTGKTHLAIERMLGHESGVIGLPLRLLAREVYDKIVARIGPRDVALITGEEKIKPERPRYWVSTVEAMPREVEPDFVAVDEIQLATDPERGHVFTDRLLSARGLSETLLLGAGTMAEPIRELLPGANFISRPRLSNLTYAGQKKITRLPRRTAIVAFSAAEVYEIAELIRRQRGGAAVVLGALSPRTRNAQVALYQSGDVDFLIATDAVGMGLNLDVDHVAFSGTRKFDGRAHRDLTLSELAQIAGRAGRHLSDGTFGVTGDAPPFSSEAIGKLENHQFDPVKTLQWRNAALDFSTIDALRESLKASPPAGRLARARMADDVLALEHFAADTQLRNLTRGPAAVRTLWDVCQIPDYRKTAQQEHAALIGTIFRALMSDEARIPEDWFAREVAAADRTDGDIDTLSARIAHVRTWTFVANRADWLEHSGQWQARTREVEDRLSDAMHDRLTQRFVDKRTSTLMKSLRAGETLYADVQENGKIYVEKHYVGQLDGFRFKHDTSSAPGADGKAARNAAARVLTEELARRVEKLAAAPDFTLGLTRAGRITWLQQDVARLIAGDHPLRPGIEVMADETIAAVDRDRALVRLIAWLDAQMNLRLKPLIELSKDETLTGMAKGIAFRLVENFGVLRREAVAEDLKTLTQEARAELRRFGVRFGAHNVFLPALLKPAAADMLVTLWLLKHGPAAGLEPGTLPDLPKSGLTSAPVNPTVPPAVLTVAGYQACGPRVVRIDMLERLADMIRPLIAFRAQDGGPQGPAGATGKGAFRITPDMLSILGCTVDEMGEVLTALGFRKERVPLPAKPAVAAAATEEAAPQAMVAADAPEASLEEAAPKMPVEPVTPEAPAEAAPVETAEAAAPEAPAEVVAPAEAAAPEATAEVEAPAEAAAPEATGEVEAPAEAAAPEATGEVAPSETPAEAATPPTHEDVWRPRRRIEANAPAARREGAPRRGSPQRDGQRAAATRPAQAARPGNGEASAANGEAHTENRPPRREADQPQGDRPQGERRDAPREGARPGDRGQRPEGDRNRPQNARPAGNRPPGQSPGDRPQGNRPQGDRGPRREGGDRRDTPRPAADRAAYSAAPPKAKTDARADSPFAALQALKARLEGQTTDGS